MPVRIRSALLLLALFTCGHDAQAGRLNFYWNDCVGDGGVTAKTFACGPSVAFEHAIGSFMLNQPMPDFCVIEVALDVHTEGPSLLPWWDFSPDPGACHGNSLSMHFDFAPLGNTSCHDPFGQPAQGGLASYAWAGGSLARVVGVGAIDVSQSKSLAAGVEYYGFDLALKLDKATGAGSCPGCAQATTLTLRNLTASGVNSREVCFGALSNYCIDWNPGLSSCATAVATQNQTWGRIKSFYR